MARGGAVRGSARRANRSLTIGLLLKNVSVASAEVVRWALKVRLRGLISARSNSDLRRRKWT